MADKSAPLSKVALALKVCHLYYEDGRSQSEIAKQLQLSRPTISRLLQFARDQGLVRIEIADPLDAIDNLATRLETKYQLQKCLIVYDASNDGAVINDKLGELTADYLDTIVQNNDSIGISWGRTLEAVANHLHPSERTGISVIQLKGSVPASDMNNFANDISTKFGNAFHTTALNLPLPVIFDSAITKDIVLKDRFIKTIIDAGANTDIALFTSGTVRDDAMLFKLGYLSPSEISRLQASSVGDIVSRFLTADGAVAETDINDRTVGISLEELRHKRYSILISGSTKKVASIHGALLGGFANVLITDSASATALLQM
ncbi:MAG: sugar-binding transcriptional regulator [Lactobacillus sp.]|jgi:deoxyribonucleoside regulator|nr:sugar-binding transcriptional regulator [Lactobacillus sp.]MCI2033729.1 sugar-binding transcriptional regulator [Lactobacillus sp.]